MARIPIPSVVNEHLFIQQHIQGQERGEQTTTLPVGSRRWYVWLDDTRHVSFSFKGQPGVFTARRERQRNGWYWYAYRKCNGKTYKTYLGKSEELTLERLNAAATALASQRVQRPTADVSQRQSAQVAATPAPIFRSPIPAIGNNLLSRPRLIACLDASMKSRLVLLSAPAGWGKTTLLAEWCGALRRQAVPFGWVALERDDDDLRLFWTKIIMGLQATRPDSDDEAQALLKSALSAPIDEAPKLLLDGLRRLSADIVLLIDNYHTIESPAIHQGLTHFLEHLPACVHLVIASRSYPPLSLAKFRVQGELIELRAADLAFTRQEACALLRKEPGCALSEEDCATLNERVEGWAAGLHLSMLALQHCAGRPEAVAAALPGSRYIADYLIEEVLLELPQDMQDFLLDICVAPVLNGPLCDAVRTGIGGQEMLARLEQRNLLLSSAERNSQGYRLYECFAAVLRDRLRQVYPGRELELQRRVCAWYERQGLVVETLEYALTVADEEMMVCILERYALALILRGQVRLVLNCLNTLSETRIRAHASICILHAFALLHTQEIGLAEVRLHNAEQCLKAEMSPGQQQQRSGRLAALRAMMAHLRGDTLQSMKQARMALELLPESDVLLRASALTLVARASFLLQNNTLSVYERQVAEMVTPIRASGNLVALLRNQADLAWIKIQAGKLREATAVLEHMQQVIQERDCADPLPGEASYYLGMGELLREWNDLETAEQYLKLGIDLIRGGTLLAADEVARGYGALALVRQARRDTQGALAILDEFTRLAYQRHFVDSLLDYCAIVRAQVYLAQGDFPTAVRLLEATERNSDGSTLNFWRERKCLVLAQVKLMQDQPAYNDVQTCASLLRLVWQEAEAREHVRSMLEAQVLLALALNTLGDSAEALDLLARCVQMAEPEGYRRLFLDKGSLLEALLRQVSAHYALSDYVQDLLSVFSKTERKSASTHTSPSVAHGDLLTSREHDVLRLLMSGASNREIAYRLIISEGTVKKHVSNICGKLSVRRRTQIVTRALSLALV